jgi:hypothetical protein
LGKGYIRQDKQRLGADILGNAFQHENCTSDQFKEPIVRGRIKMTSCNAPYHQRPATSRRR